MDFDAVTNLIKIVEQDLVKPKLLLIFDAGGMKESLLKTIELLSTQLRFLKAFLEECLTKMNDGDTRAKKLYEYIRDNVARRYEKYKIEIESGLSKVYKVESCQPHFLWTLDDLVNDFGNVRKWILEGLKETKRTALKPEEQNITVWDTYQNALEPENEVIVGFHSDIETLTNRLCYSHFMRSVLTIFRNSNIELFKKYVENYPTRWGHCHNPEQKLQVIPLVGEGGIGKTTLAKRVYGHPITNACFQIRAWVVVSQVHNLKEMLIGLLRCILPITSEIYDIDNAQIAEQLRRSLMGQKYLIFLDDIWTNAAWDAIQGCFPENFNGSHILVTTRFTKVAEYLSANPYHVAYQTLKDRWEIVSMKVFGQSQCIPREYELIGKRIVLGCSGLPLAVVVLAGLLATTKESIEIWRNVAETLDGLDTYNYNNKISKILSLSYNYLPSHLKPCFHYFGVFPKDHVIPVKRLINLWVAEGFLMPYKNMSLEEVAESYLGDLINRSLVQINELSIDGKVKSCKVHDRVT